MLNDIEIEELHIPVMLSRSSRKTLAISITQEGGLLVKAPLDMPEREIERFIKQKQYWIYKQTKHVLEEQRNRVHRSDKEVAALREKARETLKERTEYYKKMLGVDYKKIRIGDQRTRWGSCSSRGTLSYNWRLILMPEEIMDYVVVHELCHMIEMNHSPGFWSKVEEILPDYRSRRAWLKKNGSRYF